MSSPAAPLRGTADSSIAYVTPCRTRMPRGSLPQASNTAPQVQTFDMRCGPAREKARVMMRSIGRLGKGRATS